MGVSCKHLGVSAQQSSIPYTDLAIFGNILGNKPQWFTMFCSEQAGPLNTWNWNVWAVPPNYMATFATRISVVKKYMLVHFDSQTFQATVFRRTLPAMLGNWHKHDFQTGSVILIPFLLLHMHVHGVGQSSTFFVFLGSNTKNTNSLLLW